MPVLPGSPGLLFVTGWAKRSQKKPAHVRKHWAGQHFPNSLKSFFTTGRVLALTSLPAKAHRKTVARQSRRRARYTARRFQGFHSSLKRVRYCGRDAVKGQSVVIKASGVGDDRLAGVGNVQHCGSVWACPVCSHKINAVRAQDIAAAVSAWHTPAYGPQPKNAPAPLPSGRVIFLTLTMRHRAGQRLNDLWTRGISAGWGNVTSGRAWKDEQEKYGVPVNRVIKTGKRAGQVERSRRIGFARVVETTQGKNGWHVHVHALLFVHGGITSDQAMKLGDSMFGRWRDSLKAAGFGSPTLKHGVDVRLVGPADEHKVADYFSKQTFGGRDKAGKLGWEAAGGQGKNGRLGNRTPFQILADAMDGGAVDADGVVSEDMALWWEWEEASKGKRQLTWSPWLRKALKLGVELTDEEIADDELAGDVVLELRDAQWKAVEPRVEELLEAVEADEDMTLAFAWLREHCRVDGYKLYSPGEFSRSLVLVAA